MEAWFIREWQRNSLWQVLLRPVSWVYVSMVGLRRWLYRAGIFKSEPIGVPVIIVGNISVGGTGKTPVVLALAQYLTRNGWRCGIISRGYSRPAAPDTMHRPRANVIRVVAEPAGSVVMSDEAILLANRSGAPVYISADRYCAARTLLDDHPEVDVLICDDGLQHYALQRDLEICVIDGVRGFGNGALLPAGPLREPITRLGSVDAIVINGSTVPGHRDPDLELNLNLNLKNDAPTYSMILGNESLVRVRDGEQISIAQGLGEFVSKSILAIAGTGNPSRFFQHLSTLGFKAARTQAFPDHHPFVASDFANKDAQIILMTEKDAVKCKAFADDRMWFMRVDAILPDAFGEFVIKRLSALKK